MRVRRTRRTHRRGQIMLLFALVLPVILGFVALSMAASQVLNAKAKADEASLSAAIAASSDACMSSQYAFGIYKCTSPGAVIPSDPYAAFPGWANGLPAPPFTGTGTPQATNCSDGTNCVVVEHTAAQQSAEWEVSQVLTAHYPGLTPTLCADTTPAATCSGPGMLTRTTVVYQVNVSWWYYFDFGDVPAGRLALNNDSPSDDMVGPFNSSTGGTIASNGDSDTAGSPANLVCPGPLQTSGKLTLGRQIIVNVWVLYSNPFSGLIGTGTSTLPSTAKTYGCSSPQ